MSRLLITLLGGLAVLGVNASTAAASDVDEPRMEFDKAGAVVAQTSKAGTTVAPTSSIVGTGGERRIGVGKTNALPGSTGTDTSGSNVEQSEEYATAIQNCQSLPRRQKTACIDDVNKRFGQM